MNWLENKWYEFTQVLGFNEDIATKKRLKKLCKAIGDEGRLCGKIYNLNVDMDMVMKHDPDIHYRPLMISTYNELMGLCIINDIYINHRGIRVDIDCDSKVRYDQCKEILGEMIECIVKKEEGI